MWARVYVQGQGQHKQYCLKSGERGDEGFAVVEKLR